MWDSLLQGESVLKDGRVDVVALDGGRGGLSDGTGEGESGGEGEEHRCGEDGGEIKECVRER